MRKVCPADDPGILNPFLVYYDDLLHVITRQHLLLEALSGNLLHPRPQVEKIGPNDGQAYDAIDPVYIEFGTGCVTFPLVIV